MLPERSYREILNPLIYLKNFKLHNLLGLAFRWTEIKYLLLFTRLSSIR